MAEGVLVIYYNAYGVGGCFSWDLHEITIELPKDFHEKGCDFNKDLTVYVASVVFMKTTTIVTSVSSSQTTTQPQGKPLFCEGNETKSPPSLKTKGLPMLAKLTGPGEGPVKGSQVLPLTF